MTQLGAGAPRTKCFPPAWNAPAKPCDYCHSASALLYCRSDSAFMCIACDAKIHSPDEELACTKHARVWMCEVCEQAPAAVTCKADAAALCVTCDRDIHSANPLARRHERVAVVPFYDTAESVVMKSTAATLLDTAVTISASTTTATTTTMFVDQDIKVDTHEDGYISNPWMFPDPIITPKLNPDLKPMDFFFSDPDQFLEFENYQISTQPYGDSVVPVQTTIKPAGSGQIIHDNSYHSSDTRVEIDFTRSNINSYSKRYTPPSLSVSSSSVEVGIVPDALSDISYPFGQTMNPTANQASQVLGMDREARVLRYKEKRKNRKFEKTIRYASRKAYAETRPRVKGRFAKRIDGDQSDMDRIFGTGSVNFITDERYGVVPTF